MARPTRALLDQQGQLEMVIEYAPKLLAAGVTMLSLDGLLVHLAPPPPKPEVAKPEPVASSHIDPLRDPSTYPGGRVPGFDREGHE